MANDYEKEKNYNSLLSNYLGKEEIKKLSNEIKVFDFYGQPTKYHYSKAKIIDMYGFQVGYLKSGIDNLFR